MELIKIDCETFDNINYRNLNLEQSKKEKKFMKIEELNYKLKEVEVMISIEELNKYFTV